MSISKRKKKSVIKKFQKNENDTGSAEVQIGLLGKRIEELADHLKKHPKDRHSRRGLLMMVGKRRRLMKYLSRETKTSYEEVAKKFKLGK